MSNAASKSAVNTWVKRLVSRFKQDLYPYVPASSADVWTELREIVSKAVKLDEVMTRSRALLTISHWEGEEFASMKFDESSMESAAGFATPHSGMLVNLVLAPSLVKRGTADGEGYEKTTVLSKWVVICRESRKR